jgi:hypothetical protein
VALSGGCHFIECSAQTDGGGIGVKEGSLQLSDTNFTRCFVASSGGGLKVQAGGHLHAERCFITKCTTDIANANSAVDVLEGAVCSFGGNSAAGIEMDGSKSVAILIECEISQCTSTSSSALYVGGGLLEFKRCVLKENVACAWGASGRMGGGTMRLKDCKVFNNFADVTGGGCFVLGSESATIELIDTVLDKCRTGTTGPGAAILISAAGGNLIARNATISRSTSASDSAISIAAPASVFTFESTLLTLIPPCPLDTHVYRGTLNAYDPSPLINLVGEAVKDAETIYSRLRGFKVRRPADCAQTEPVTSATVMGTAASLPTCTTRSDHCGPYARCESALVSPDLTLTTPVCGCNGLNAPFPDPSGTYSQHVTPYIQSLGCTTPREGVGVGIAAIEVAEVVLDLTKPATGSRTLTLRMAGTAETGSTWGIDSSSVPDWMQILNLSGSVLTPPYGGSYGSMENEASVVTIVAITKGLFDRKDPYEERLRLSVFSDKTTVFEVPVLLKLTVVDVPAKSTWGSVAPAGQDGLRDPCRNAVPPPNTTAIDAPYSVPFTSCDEDALPVAHVLATDTFKATLRRVRDDRTKAASVIAISEGVYQVVFPATVENNGQLQHLGDYVVSLLFAAEPFGGGDFHFKTHCPAARPREAKDGLTCGCAPGTKPDSAGSCTPCEDGFWNEVGDAECLMCAEVGLRTGRCSPAHVCPDHCGAAWSVQSVTKSTYFADHRVCFAASTGLLCTLRLRERHEQDQCKM